ncbi:MAG: hypothetical protein ACJ74T_09710 [Pyrinomonadaceae bacterium]
MRLTHYLLPIILMLSFSVALGRQVDAYISAVIEHAESQFALGQAYLGANKQKEAKEAFDKAVDIILESKVSIKESPKLRSYYLELVEKIYQIEAAGARGETLGFNEQKFEPSPLDELRASVLDKKSEAEPKPCNQSASAHIELRGLRLGMPVAAVRARFPALIIPPPDKYGYSLASVSFEKRPAADLTLKDVLRVTTSFLDGKVASVTLVYANAVNWESGVQFVQQVAVSMNLDGTWGRYEGESGVYQMRCDKTTIIAGLFGDGRRRLPFATLRDEHADYLRRSRIVDEAVRKAKAVEDRRKAFKP